MRSPFGFRELAGVAAVFAVLAVGSARARADVLPSEPSFKPCVAPGQPCVTEGVEAEAGTCVAATCTKQVRNRDGGTTPVGVPCFQCVAGAKGSKSQATSKSSGCAVAPERGDAGSPARAASMWVIAGLMLVATRRRTPAIDRGRALTIACEPKED
jgi:MYXO-CTERM domain-containing protein